MASSSFDILTFLAPFAILFSSSVSWNKASTLFIGTLLCKGKRTICSVLRVLGLQDIKSFSKYHHVLNRTNWNLLLGSKILLNMILNVIGKGEPLKILVDETLERRKGKKIKIKGYYRDPIRSSQNKVVTCKGIKWLTFTALCKFPFASRSFALPFMTIPEPSKESNTKSGKRHRTCIEWTCQALMEILRWSLKAPLILIGDGGFASAKLAWLCLKHSITLITRLKMNAALYTYPEITAGQPGRKPKKGKPIQSFGEMAKRKDLVWKEFIKREGEKKEKRMKYIANTSLWCVNGFDPIPIKWVLLVDFETGNPIMPLMTTNVQLSAEEIIELYFERWNIEVTFEEVREHLGVETQRQWSDLAIARTTPILMASYTLVCLIANQLHEKKPIELAKTSWDEKKDAAFSDLLTSVREVLWRDNLISKKGRFEHFLGNNKQENVTNISNPADLCLDDTLIDFLVEYLAAA